MAKRANHSPSGQDATRTAEAESVFSVAREWFLATPKDATATATRECRLQFLRAAVEHQRIRLGDTLRAKVFKPAEQKWIDLGIPPLTQIDRWNHERVKTLIPSLHAERARLIKEWAAGHNLAYEWVCVEAERTLIPGRFPDQLFTSVPAYGAPVFIWPSWGEGESEPEYRRLAKVAFRKQLDRFIRGVNLERNRFLNHRDPYSQKKHYRWAVEHVCLRWGWSKIVSENPTSVNVTWQAVEKAVRPLLERIGISRSSQP